MIFLYMILNIELVQRRTSKWLTITCHFGVRDIESLFDVDFDKLWEG